MSYSLWVRESVDAPWTRLGDELFGLADQRAWSEQVKAGLARFDWEDDEQGEKFEPGPERDLYWSPEDF